VETAKAEAKFQTQRVDGIRTNLEGIQSQHTSWARDHATHTSTIQARLNKIRGVSLNIESELKTLRQSVPPDLSGQEFLEQEQEEARKLQTSISALGYQADALTGEIDSRAARPDTCASCEQALPPERVKINQAALENGKVKRGELQQQKGENEARLYNAQANVGIANEIIGLESRLDERAEQTGLEDILTVAKETRNPFDITIKAYAAELEKEATMADALLKIIDAEAKHRDHLHFWHHAFGTDLKTLMFEKICPFLEDKANQYLRDLNNGQITVSFDTTKTMKSGDTKDQFCVTASTTTGSEVFELFSGAEKQLTSFAVGMALADLAALQVEGASKFMILDEPFTMLSPENCENIVNFIRTHKMGDSSTVLLISNEHNLTSLIQNRIHVVKKNGVTSIE
jgi:DNA repair exonuclease SbcCD ATPase subunit